MLLSLREGGRRLIARQARKRHRREEIYSTQPMQGENKQRWEELAAQAAIEQDPVKMLQLITEINKLLLEKEERLVKNQSSR